MRGHGGLQGREAREAPVMHQRDGDLMAVTQVAIIVPTESSSNN
jgi:hypothetical protein